VTIKPINQNGGPNFAGMNVELLFRKDKNLVKLYKDWGSISTVKLPEKYKQLWNDINDKIQNKKLDNSNILEPTKREEILGKLKKRAYYLTRIAEVYDAKNIVEVGTAEGWQFFSFGEYAKEKKGLVISCDPRDVRNKKCIDEYQGTCYYFQDTSEYLGKSNQVNNVDLFYIDGMHDEGTVIRDVVNLANKQTNNPVWIFDDFDVRFGCFNDIVKLIGASQGFKIWNVGLTASGKPSHQVMVNSKFIIKN